MCEDIYGKIVVLLLLLPLGVTALLAIWYGFEIMVDKVCQNINKENEVEKSESPIIPTENQVMLIKSATSKMYMQVSKKHILRVILEWEKIRNSPK
jgi:hypothetical protein